MEKIHVHENVHVFVLSCKFKHESTKTCMFLCKVSILSSHYIILGKRLCFAFSHQKRKQYFVVVIICQMLL